MLLDVGDMKPFRIVRELSRIGLDGCLSPDHLQPIHNDSCTASQALTYSTGYLRVLLPPLSA